MLCDLDLHTKVIHMLLKYCSEWVLCMCKKLRLYLAYKAYYSATCSFWLNHSLPD